MSQGTETFRKAGGRDLGRMAKGPAASIGTSLRPDSNGVMNIVQPSDTRRKGSAWRKKSGADRYGHEQGSSRKGNSCSFQNVRSLRLLLGQSKPASTDNRGVEDFPLSSIFSKCPIDSRDNGLAQSRHVLPCFGDEEWFLDNDLSQRNLVRRVRANSELASQEGALIQYVIVSELRDVTIGGPSHRAIGR